MELGDLSQSACVILSGVLHFTGAGTAGGMTAGFALALASGSYLVVSVGSGNGVRG